MNNSRVSAIKRGQKQSLYLREISKLIQALSLDVDVIAKIYVSRVDLSKDTGICYVYFGSYTTPQAFDDALEALKLYKSSLRSALAKQVQTRYVPDLKFLYDEQVEKERHMHSLLDSVKEESERIDEQRDDNQSNSEE